MSAFGRRAGPVAVLAWTVVGLLVVSLGLSVGALVASARADDGSQGARALAGAARTVQATLLDAETGQRGYLLTTQDDFLDPYHDASASLADQLGRLERAAARLEDPALAAAASRLAELARSRMAAIDATVTLARSGSVAEAVTLVAQGRGKQAMDEIRASVERLEADAAADRAARDASRLRGAAVAAAAVTTAALVVLVLLVQRQRRVLQAEQVRADRRADEALRRLERLAVQDPLTGLAHRRSAEAHLERALARAGRDGTALAVVLCDLDRFTDLNERHGGAAGDAVLRATADGLETLAGPVDLLARVGADEFLLVVERVPSLLAVDDLAARTVRRASRPLELEGGTVRISASVGVVALGLDGATSLEGPGGPGGLDGGGGGGDGGDGGGDLPGLGSVPRAARIMAAAEEAAMMAKHAGGGRAHRWDPARDHLRSEGFRLSGELRQALEERHGDGLWVAYQPLVDLQDGALYGFEALVRWEHPRRGALPPAAFVPLAESSDLVVALDRYVLRAACTQAAAWNAERRTRGEAPLRLSVNCSPRDLADPGLVAATRRVLDETGLAPPSLVLEITESGVVQGTRTVGERLDELVDLGVSIAIDDFGAGYSSMSYLTSLPVSVVKVDRSIVQGLGTSAADEAVVAAISSLAERLGQQVLAEGIEEAEQVPRALDLGCRFAQGYHFGRPVPADQARALALPLAGGGAA
ncbi:putative bifunctional diguanylate cyclase/phosphodiesterase [Cellulomonas endophytica]|uniref:putative bifunctional diguanylate cyclase/phosphodiesterase n=1 Tax=Cellulomonas endophytica TaxID=2494735 RepID=UPI0013E90CB6|nr:EAL domain-containing protein [Cellulomonas endophytica]